MLRLFANLKLAYKLLIPIAVLIATVGIIVWSAANGLGELTANVDHIVTVNAVRRAATLDLGMQANQAGLDTKNVIIESDADAVRGYNEDFKQAIGVALADADKLLDLADTPRWKSAAEKLRAVTLNFKDSGQRTIDFAAKGDVAAATKVTLGEQRAARKAINESIAECVKMASQEMAEAQTNAQTLGRNVLQALYATVGIGLALSLSLLGGVLVFLVVRPLAASTATMDRLARGDLAVAVTGVERKDEIGILARSLQVFKDNAIEAKRLAAEQEELKARAAAEQKAALRRLADAFEASVGGIVNVVASASTEMQSAAESLSMTAEETNRQASAVAAAATQSSSNVQSVASATEELSVSISEIARQVSQSTQIADEAKEEVRHVNDNVGGLSVAAQKIGDVVDLIQNIASQTNLLALNATIEAARAGDHGKGFAVVASEVKALANQTAKATDEIAKHIEAIQSATNSAVTAIEQIGGTIAKVGEIATTIASAVEQQGAATKDISSNVSQAASGTSEVSSNIVAVTEAAGNVGAASSQMLGSATELSKQSERLKQEVSSFLANVRAA